MSDRFDFEQQIMDCWGITKDIETLTQGVLEHEMNTDQISNVLIGMSQLYDLKFQIMFD